MKRRILWKYLRSSDRISSRKVCPARSSFSLDVTTIPMRNALNVVTREWKKNGRKETHLSRVRVDVQMRERERRGEGRVEGLQPLHSNELTVSELEREGEREREIQMWISDIEIPLNQLALTTFLMRSMTMIFPSGIFWESKVNDAHRTLTHLTGRFCHLGPPSNLFTSPTSPVRKKPSTNASFDFSESLK